MIPRCFVDAARWSEKRVRLSAQDSHHLSEVLRCEEGDRVDVCDGQGGIATARIAGMMDGCVVVEVLGRASQTRASVMVTLVQAIPKSDKFEWIIQKATEIGVWNIIPVVTERGVVRLDGDRAAQRVERWQRIAVEAARQCRTAWIPRVASVATFSQFLSAGFHSELALIGSLEESAIPLRTCLRDRNAPPTSVTLCIGPEGDFSPSEMAAARAGGAIPVSYGKRVLRVETAALYGLSALAYEYALGE